MVTEDSTKIAGNHMACSFSSCTSHVGIPKFGIGVGVGGSTVEDGAGNAVKRKDYQLVHGDSKHYTWSHLGTK